MKKLIIILILIKVLCIRSSAAQNFFPLPPGFNSIVRTLFYDTSSNVLYAGGNFNGLAGNIVTMQHISRWNGSTWDSLGAGLFGNVYSIVNYNGLIYAGGSFAIINNIDTFLTANIAYWDGVYWQLLPGGVTVSGAVGKLFVNGNDLYVGGVFDTIAGIAAQGVARYDGTLWHSYPTLDPVYSAFVTDILIFNNDLYVGGGFYSGPLGNIVKYNGTSWVSVGGGIPHNNSFISDMMVYQGELYIVGDFQISTGGPGSCVAKWNGTTWSDLGTGLQPTGGQLFGITAFKNEIYVGGSFSTIGGISSPQIAKWDGTNWNSLGSVFNNGVSCFASYGNDLYIGGGFITIDSDTMRAITRYTPPLGIQEENVVMNQINLYPNPATNIITVDYYVPASVSNPQLILSAITGEKIKIFSIRKGKQTTELNIKDVSSGVYFLNLAIENKIMVSRKLVVISE